MDLENIENLKKRLERNIGYIINQFEDETGLEVEHIFINRYSMPIKIRSDVKLKNKEL